MDETGDYHVSEISQSPKTQVLTVVSDMWMLIHYNVCAVGEGGTEQKFIGLDKGNEGKGGRTGTGKNSRIKRQNFPILIYEYTTSVIPHHVQQEECDPNKL